MKIARQSNIVFRWLFVVLGVVVASVILFVCFEIFINISPFFGLYIENPIREKGEIDRYVTDIAWSKNGQSLYYARNITDDDKSPATFYRYDVQKKKRYFIGKYEGRFIDISPDERDILVATEDNKYISIINIATGSRQELHLPNTPDGPRNEFVGDYGVYWSAAGIIYFGGQHVKVNNLYCQKMYCFDPKTQSVQTYSLPPTKKESYSLIQPSIDGQLYGYAISKTKYQIVDMSTKKVINIIDISGWNAFSCALFTKSRLLFADGVMNYTSFDIATGKRESIPIPDLIYGSTPSYTKLSPDLRYIAGVYYGGGDFYNTQPGLLRLYKL